MKLDATDSTKIPLPTEVWVVFSQHERGQYSSDFVADYKHGAMEHANVMSGDEEGASLFGPYRVARYVADTVSETLRKEEIERLIATAAQHLRTWATSKNKEPYANTMEIALRLDALVAQLGSEPRSATLKPIPLNESSIKSNAPDLRKALPQRFHHFFDLLVEQACRSGGM